MTNIIYYDENIDKYIKSIHNDSDLFERKTPGIFILCTNILSLDYVMKKIRNCMLLKCYNFLYLFGVGERVRTSAPMTRPSSLANCPLHHLGTPTFIIKKVVEYCL